MGILYQNILNNFKHLAVFMAGIFLLVLMPASLAYAQPSTNCFIVGGSLFPSQPNWVSQFGDARKAGVRRHTGLDIGYPVNHTTPQPPGCEILLNSAGGYRFNNKNQPIDNGNKQIIGSDTGGYGYQMFYRCGTPDGDQITLRYAHMPQNPLSSNKQLIQGCSGSSGCGYASHYHFEIIIGDRPVDPECVMFGVKPGFGLTNICNSGGGDCAPQACRTCPPSLPAGALNMCDKTVRDTLIKHGQTCTTTPKYPNGQTRAVPGGKSISQDRLGPTNGTGDPPTNPVVPDQPPGTPPPDDDHDGSDDDATDGGGFTGDPTIYYPPSPPDPPVQPPPPDVPGIPGGSPDLVPPPGPGGEPDEVTGCAADTWAAMVNQAVMETRREDILNKRFIVKPDTVIDYSCFDLHTKITADAAGPIFSETKFWANKTVDLYGKTVQVKRELGSKSLDGALMDIVQSIAENYGRGQFNNPYLAGTTPVTASATKDNCDVMANVWKAAKCKNFDDVNVFYTFEDLKTKEPREYPANMKCD